MGNIGNQTIGNCIIQPVLFVLLPVSTNISCITKINFIIKDFLVQRRTFITELNLQGG